DRHCRFPGCTRPAEDCDLDHTQPFRHHHEHEHDSGQEAVPWQKAVPEQEAVSERDDDQGGSTSADNLASLCRFTHRAKTHGHYHTRQDPDGTLHLSTPLGRTYTTKPWDYRPDSER
ncbi:MAG: hypothetical protein QOI76_759, partial [Frankiales bacterium]|nr:hypothetical protein [Frankiales bacterium]